MEGNGGSGGKQVGECRPFGDVDMELGQDQES